MAFNLERFFSAIFQPGKNESITIMYDFPHGDLKDNAEWKERRIMAEEWRGKLKAIDGFNVNPVVTYPATGNDNANLPSKCFCENQEVNVESIIENSSIILSMVEFSATAPLYYWAKKNDKLRVGSMPGVAKFMEESGLSANYTQISKIGNQLKKILDPAIGAEVEFSSGHRCYFDLAHSYFDIDDGILYPERGGGELAVSNLPAGEVYCVPNENNDSKTNGELPWKTKDNFVVFSVENNKINKVSGNGPDVKKIRERFLNEPGIQNIAEFAIGINNKAKVTGNVLEDEKAGFHFAFGRSDHLGGRIGPESFLNPDNVEHTDIVFAKESEVICKRLEFFFEEGKSLVLIENGKLNY